MNQNSISHLAPHTGSVQVWKNTPIFLHLFGLRVQLYARSKVSMAIIKDTQNSMVWVLIVPYTPLARTSANHLSRPYHTIPLLKNLFIDYEKLTGLRRSFVKK